MQSLPHSPRNSSSLTADEREVVVSYNDAEKVWRVYSDSATMRARILRLARQVEADVHQVGSGIEFEVPAAALRLTGKRRGGGRGRPFALRKSAGPASVEGTGAVLDGPLEAKP